MTGPVKTFLILGSVNAALSVILGAFGAHALKSRLSPDMLAIFRTGVEYHIYHALGLFAVGFVASLYPSSALVRWSGGLMLFGIVLFSGSLYLLSVSGARWLGAITPIGGIAFVVSWVLLAATLLRD
jgi:uncharacterized membrane protein YgdD (TMEM256/DUF423 family)